MIPSALKLPQNRSSSDLFQTHEPPFSKGGRFRTEQDLVGTFSEGMIPQVNLHVSYEFDCQHGIADIVLSRPNTNTKNLDLGRLPANWTYALKTLPYRKKFDTEDFCVRTSTSWKQARQILVQFEKAGFVKPGASKDTWIKYRQPAPVTQEIVAIEAKLSKWRHALFQATRYQHFAHYSWVVLDRASRKAALSNLKMFKKFNIGLASVSIHGEIELHFAPIKKTPKTPYLFWMANVKLAQELTR